MECPWNGNVFGCKLSGDVRKGISGGIIRGNVRKERPGTVRIPTKNYKSLRVAVMTCGTLVNIDRHI